MDLTQSLARERRARLAAERLLEQKQVELSVANRELSKHARALSVEVIEKREEVEGVRLDLELAETKVGVAERRLWTSLTTIEDGFAVFDVNDVLVVANPAWLRPFDGVAAVRPGATYADILTIALEEGMIDIGPERPSVWRSRMLGRWQSERLEPEVIRLWNGSFIRLVDRRGEGGDMVSLALDITQQMKNEARLKDARSRAETANRAKSAFLANMSHELRTPMNGVVAMADMLAETGLDEDQMSFVDTIRSSGEALLVIINDILDVSKLDAHKMTLHPEPFDLEQTVQNVLQLVQPLARGKALDLRVDYDLFLPTRFVGDVGRLRQVLTNLVGNAVKFTDAGHVLVRVTGREEGGHWQVHVTVEDTGIGIAPDQTRHVFGEFNQVEDERNRKYEGTGLGLAITERLVRLMQGEIWVASEVGKGSCFGFRIPLPLALDETLPQPAPRNVLVIDPVRAEVLRAQLIALGMRVSLRADAATALADPAADVGLVLAALPLAGMAPGDLMKGLAAKGIAAPLVAIADSTESGTDPAVTAVLRCPLSRRDLLKMLRDLPVPAVTAPAADPVTEPAATAVATAQPSRTPDAVSGPRRMKVLAAEDNKTNQLVLGKMLRALDIELRFANDGHEAVALHGGWQPDLIFMDISMPGMDGKEATQVIRRAEAATGRHTPICALTAHALNGDERSILAAGLDHYLTKPLKKTAILERIRSARPPGCCPVEPEAGTAAAPATVPIPPPAVTGPAAASQPEPTPATTEPEATAFGFASRRHRATAAE
jgi:signal transduction histidine kinase/ActR/RegA family two-component response regulator